jgi:hypothetical protein
MPVPDLQTLDVDVEHRIARVTIDHRPINLMDATLVEELDQLVGWLAKQGDSVRVVIFQSAVPDFFLAHLDLDLIQDTIDDPDPDAALESFQGLVARYNQLDQVTIAKVAGRVGGGVASFFSILTFALPCVAGQCSTSSRPAWESFPPDRDPSICPACWDVVAPSRSSSDTTTSTLISPSATAG